MGRRASKKLENAKRIVSGPSAEVTKRNESETNLEVLSVETPKSKKRKRTKDADIKVKEKKADDKDLSLAVNGDVTRKKKTQRGRRALKKNKSAKLTAGDSAEVKKLTNSESSLKGLSVKSSQSKKIKLSEDDGIAENNINEGKKRKRFKKKKKKLFNKRNKYLHLVLPNANKEDAELVNAGNLMDTMKCKKDSKSRIQDSAKDSSVIKKRKRKRESNSPEHAAKKLKSGDSEKNSKEKRKKKSLFEMSSAKNTTSCLQTDSVEKVKKKHKKKKHSDNDADTNSVFESANQNDSVNSVDDSHIENVENIDDNWEHHPAKQKRKKQGESDPLLIVEKSKKLKHRMLEKLSASRFRYLNEQLYNMTGKAAYKLFHEDPSAFEVYHNGFKNQVAKWPMNPLKVIIKSIKSQPPSMVIADFGCGDAELASKLTKNTVHSFDLVAVNERVVACDMSQVPLRSASVDIAVFCLSLMGTNILDYLQEAHRVLKHGGTLKIAEVESRFRKVAHFIKHVEKLGFTLLSKDLNHDMFVFFDFEKSGQFHRNRVHKLKLNPCVYKKR